MLFSAPLFPSQMIDSKSFNNSVRYIFFAATSWSRFWRVVCAANIITWCRLKPLLKSRAKSFGLKERGDVGDHISLCSSIEFYIFIYLYILLVKYFIYIVRLFNLVKMKFIYELFQPFVLHRFILQIK